MNEKHDVDEMVENIEEEMVENAQESIGAEEEMVEKVEEHVEEVRNEECAVPVTKKVKKHIMATQLVEEAKKIVQEADEQTDACKLLLADDLKEFDNAISELKAGGMDACKSLLEQFGMHEGEGIEERIEVFLPKDEVEPIVLKNVSSGKFTGLIYALLGGSVTFGGLVYLASTKLGIPLGIKTLPSKEQIENILTWFSKAVGLESNLYIGSAILAAATLLVMAIIYAIRVSLRGSKNLHFAEKQLSDATLYTQVKGECKAEMDRVDAHMKETITTLKMYEVLFNEQKGKLERILHMEGQKENIDDYHEKSYLEMQETKELINAVKDFITTPMSDEGRLSEASVTHLAHANAQIDKVLKRLYE